MASFCNGAPYPRRRVAKGHPIAVEIGVVAHIERRHDDREPWVIRCDTGGEGCQLAPGWKPTPCRFPYFALCLDDEPVRLRGGNFNRNTGGQLNIARGKLGREGDHCLNQHGSPPQEGPFGGFEVLQCYKPLWERG